MSHVQYVALLADLLSGDPERVREANQKLYDAVVEEVGSGPSYALIDAERQLSAPV